MSIRTKYATQNETLYGAAADTDSFARLAPPYSPHPRVTCRCSPKPSIPNRITSPATK
jgi:hypothetical protein